MIGVHDVEATSRWYQSVLGFQSGHGGSEYEELLSDGRLVMQLHHWNADEHPHMGDQASRPYGNGVVLWFQTQNISAAFERAQAAKAEILESLHVNPNANHREFWTRDPNGYVVGVAGEHGDLGGALGRT